MKNQNIAGAAKSGFSLIELLAAMAILMTIVSMMALIFSDSDRAWNFGADTSENSNSGRAALDMIVQDLQYAIADDLITFCKRRDRSASLQPPYNFANIGLGRCDEINFVSLQHDSSEANSPTRTAREIMYWVNTNKIMESTGEFVQRYELIRGMYSGEIADTTAFTYKLHCYTNRNWYEDIPYNGAGRPVTNWAVIAENVAGLSFKTPWDDTLANGYAFKSANNLNTLPPFIDVYLEIMDRRVAMEVARMGEMGIAPEDIRKKVEKNLKRYSTRVFFFNRFGYWVRHQNPDKYPFATDMVP